MHRCKGLALLVAAAAILTSGCSVGVPRPPSDVTASSATLNGFVFSTEKDVDVQYWFRYGPTTAYGSLTPERTLHIPAEPNYYDPHPISEPVTGLTPWSDYHYQVCTAPPRAGCLSADEVFTAGPRLAFFAERPDGEIWVMDAGGHHQKRLTTELFPLKPAVSPDGTKIAFEANTGQGNTGVWVMNSDGSDQHAITSPATFATGPAWSPDGAKIAFARGIQPSEIAVMDAEGGNVTALTSDGGIAQQPAWSPDGSTIAFTFTGAPDQFEVRSVPAQGGAEVTLADDGFMPTWSPDSSRIAFTHAFDIWVMDADGQNPTQLTDDAAEDTWADWSPDGSRIAFDKIDNRTHRVVVMHADGSNPIFLTGLDSHAGMPSWFPFVEGGPTPTRP